MKHLRRISGKLCCSQHAAAVLHHYTLLETPLLPSTPELSMCLQCSETKAHLFALLSHSGYWSTSFRPRGERMKTRWSRCEVSCRTSRRRTTGSSSYWPRTCSCLRRPGSKPACSTRSPGSPTRTWYATTHTPTNYCLKPSRHRDTQKYTHTHTYTEAESL